MAYDEPKAPALELIPGGPDRHPIRTRPLSVDLDADGFGTICVGYPRSKEAKLKHKLLKARFPHAEIKIAENGSEDDGH